MIKVATLASSSRGNSSLVMGENTIILIDAGINLSTLIEKLKKFNLSPNDIDAILCTHEHSDHSKSVGAFMRKSNCKLYVHAHGKEPILKKVGKVNLNNVITYYDATFNIGEFLVKGFKVPHDSVCCMGFVIAQGDIKIAYATDLGVAYDEIVENLKGCRLVILESNHDEQLLINNDNYPDYLKHRILSDNGHLSNISCAKVISTLAQHNVRQVVLAHLSLENNTPELCYSTICNYLNTVGIVPGVNIKIDIAPAFNIGTVFVLK